MLRKSDQVQGAELSEDFPWRKLVIFIATIVGNHGFEISVALLSGLCQDFVVEIIDQWSESLLALIQLYDFD